MVRRIDYVGGSYPMEERDDGDYVEYDDYSAMELRLTSIISEVQSEVEGERKLRLSAESRIAELEKDAARIDSLEDVVCASRTGVTIERVRYAEDGYVVDSGLRAMKFHAVTELKSTIREAIDELLSREA